MTTPTISPVIASGVRVRTQDDRVVLEVATSKPAGTVAVHMTTTTASQLARALEDAATFVACKGD